MSQYENMTKDRLKEELTRVNVCIAQMTIDHADTTMLQQHKQKILLELTKRLGDV